MREIDAATLGLEPGATGDAPEGYTGRYLVLLEEDAVDEGIQTLRAEADLEVAVASPDQSTTETLEQAGETDGLLFESLGVALVDGNPEQMQEGRAAGGGNGGVLAVEPERVVRAWHEGTTAPSADYLRGFRDAIDHLLGATSAPPGARGAEAPSAAPASPEIQGFDESQATWGLQVTGAAESCFGGQGIRVAVLDTGFDLGHPDFKDRSVKSLSLVPGETVQDLHGHGTHCIGTACGPRRPGALPRYGVAHRAEIYAGKVLSNQGRGTDSWILGGIAWAMLQGCRVVSMSLGAPVRPGQSFSLVFENVARRALAQGTLIVAAAGNDSQRRLGVVRPVGHPANCPSIMAVGALDSRLQVAHFSNQGINPEGGAIDVAAPGVDVRSSWPAPALYRTISGTSMATPHVAGIAALLAEDEGVKGTVLQERLVESCRPLALPTEDVGAGLVQAP
jgi:subtilisin family serine protease